MHQRQFASDNNSGICPEALAALLEANHGHAPGYGDDLWTQRAADLLRELFQTDCEVFFAFNGTAANALALASMCQSYHSILCHEYAHIERDECGAPEFFSNGTKLLLLTGEHGKVDASSIEKTVSRRNDIHYPKPRVLSLTQATEMGTIYSPDELTVLCGVAHELGLKVHMDGARFANAVAALGASPAQMSWQSGVDVLCFGATKNGLAIGEAVVFFDRSQAVEFEYRCKQAGQLASKMRFITAPWAGLLEDGAWLRHAAHSNEMARLLEELLDGVGGVRLLHPRQANAVFVELPPTAQDHLRVHGWRFYNFIGESGCRLMCSWDTTEQDVHSFVDCLRQAD